VVEDADAQTFSVLDGFSMFDFNLMKITAEQIQSGRTLSESLDVAKARHIYLTEEWTHPSCLP